MSTGLTAFRQKIAEQLEELGIPAAAAFEPADKTVRSGPVAAVSLAEVVCQKGGFQDYLGRRTDEDGTAEELYGREVELTAALDIYGPRDSGETVCRTLADQMAERVLLEGLAGLTVHRMESGKMEFLDSCGMYRLPVRCVCRGWLAAAVREDGEFVDIEVKGRKL